jgi:hypothetical protein
MVSVEWHAQLRRSPLSSWVIGLKDRLDYARWRRANVAGSTCPLQKRYALLDLLRTHKLGLAVETGTFLGDTATFLSGHGYDVITIELDPRLAALARLRFRGNRHVQLIEGDSGTRLPAVVAELKRPTLFYLDAHYSGPGTGKGKRRFPRRSISSCDGRRPAAWLPSTMRAASAPPPIIRRSSNFSARCVRAASTMPA